MNKKEIAELVRKAERLEKLCEELVSQKEGVLDAMGLQVTNDNGEDVEADEPIALKAILAGEKHDEY